MPASTRGATFQLRLPKYMLAKYDLFYQGCATFQMRLPKYCPNMLASTRGVLNSR